MKILAKLIKDVKPADRPQLTPYAHAQFHPFSLSIYSSETLYKHEQTLIQHLYSGVYLLN